MISWESYVSSLTIRHHPPKNEAVFWFSVLIFIRLFFILFWASFFSLWLRVVHARPWSMYCPHTYLTVAPWRLYLELNLGIIWIEDGHTRSWPATSAVSPKVGRCPVYLYRRRLTRGKLPSVLFVVYFCSMNSTSSVSSQIQVTNYPLNRAWAYLSDSSATGRGLARSLKGAGRTRWMGLVKLSIFC